MFCRKLPLPSQTTSKVDSLKMTFAYIRFRFPDDMRSIHGFLSEDQDRHRPNFPARWSFLFSAFPWCDAMRRHGLVVVHYGWLFGREIHWFGVSEISRTPYSHECFSLEQNECRTNHWTLIVSISKWQPNEFEAKASKLAQGVRHPWMHGSSPNCKVKYPWSLIRLRW